MPRRGGARDSAANDLCYDSWASLEPYAASLGSLQGSQGLVCGHHLGCCYAAPHLFFYRVPKATLDTLAAEVWHRFRPLFLLSGSAPRFYGVPKRL